MCVYVYVSASQSIFNFPLVQRSQNKIWNQFTVSSCCLKNMSETALCEPNDRNLKSLSNAEIYRLIGKFPDLWDSCINLMPISDEKT